jgi:hypothetical protein
MTAPAPQPKPTAVEGSQPANASARAGGVMKLEISEPSTRSAGGILVIDTDAVEDIAEFFHNEHSNVAQSYETALSLAQNFVQGADKLDRAWEAINALGGSGSTPEELAFVYAIERALDEIEALGGMDPKQRALVMPLEQEKSHD